MTAVWDKLFGNSPYPANDPPSVALQNHLSRDEDEAPAREKPILSRAPEPARNVSAGSKSVASTFDSIGRRNETLRAELDAIEFAFSNIEQIRSHFLSVLAPIGEILSEIERTNTMRHDAESKLDMLAAAHVKLRSENAELTIDRNASALKLAEFSARSGDHDRLMQRATVELNEARAGLGIQIARAERTERELEDSKRRLVTVSEQLPSLRTEFLAKEKRLQEVEQQRAGLEDRNKLATQELRGLRARIEEMVGNISKLNRKNNELEGRNSDGLRRISELEAALDQEIAAHSRLKTAHLDDSETHRLEIANLQEEVSALNIRSEAADRLLGDSRAEVRERNAAVRTHEQSSLETSVLLQTHEQSQAELQHMLAAAHSKQSEAENARAATEARANDLLRALETKAPALKRAEDQVAALEARMTSEVKLAISELESRDGMIARLRADLETQSSARAFAEGALQSARQERVSWRNAVDANATAVNEVAREKLNRLRA